MAGVFFSQDGIEPRTRSKFNTTDLKCSFSEVDIKMNSIFRISPLLRQSLPRLSVFRYSSTNAGSQENIESLVKDDKVVVFMKGHQEEPMCGFSNAVVQILRMHNVKFSSHNVLDNDDLRQGIKEYSEWPTIPQVFMDGEFVGGCDIMLQMHQNGELIEELKKIGIRSALLDQENDDKK